MGSRKAKTTLRSGIYKIVHKLSGKKYIGSASNIPSRWTVHRFHLRRGTHHCIHLQRAWNKYGESAFVYQVIIYCGINRLKEVEQKYLDTEPHLYNICPSSFYLSGFKHSEETKRKMSEAAVAISNRPGQSKLRSERAKALRKSGKLRRKHYPIKSRECVTCGIDWTPERLPSGNLSQSKHCTECRPEHKGGQYKYERTLWGEGTPKQHYKPSKD